VNYEEEDQAMPEEELLKNNKRKDKGKKEKRSVKVKINALVAKGEVRREHNDAVYYEKLNAKKPDIAQPLQKGSVDMWFLLWAMILLCFGIVMCYSAGVVDAIESYDDPLHYLVRNVLLSIVAIGGTSLFVLFARPWFWRRFSVFIYILSVILLIIVLFWGRVGGGAERWIPVGPITVQPSEVAKLAVVMLLALYLEKHEKQVNSLQKFGGHFKHGFLIPMFIIGLLCLFIIFQPHISGVMIVGILGLGVMFMGGTRLRWLFLLLGCIGVAFIVLINVSSYAQARMDIWLKIDEMDALGDAWQTLQGLNAIGSGGFFGLGLGASRQKYGYVPEPQNDFIFTIICEELGFVGAFGLVFLFALLIWRGIKIGQNAPDKFSALVVWGLTFKIALQVAMNIAVVTNMMPNTGISLPFFSAGGSALVMQIFEVGIILSISRFSTQKK
jgi:cell division protein FtsW